MNCDVLIGDATEKLRTLPAESVHMVVTSPPYWGLRDYSIEPSIWGGDPSCNHVWVDHTVRSANGSSTPMLGETKNSASATRHPYSSAFCICGAWLGCFGLEPTPQLYIEHAVLIFRDIRRVLRDDGTLWLNMGDSYNGQNERSPSILPNGQYSFRSGSGPKVRVAGLKAKDLIGMPWRLALALQEDGWYLRQDIVWAKKNPMPESVADRCTKSHEYIFLLSKSKEYFFDAEAIKEKASINTHSRGGGVNPKAKKEGQHSRIQVDRDPRHTKDTGVGWGRLSKIAPNNNQKERGRIAKGLRASASFGRTPGWREKQNESFSAAVTEIVTHRNKRSVWTFATSPYREAHYATFPITLPDICIRAGTSERGCCAVCGRALARIVETIESDLIQKTANGWDISEGPHGSIHPDGRDGGTTKRPVLLTRTIGWESCCSLFGGSVNPCTVLDPFAGAGTTALAALRLGRSCILIDIDPKNVPLIEKRLRPVLHPEAPKPRRKKVPKIAAPETTKDLSPASFR